MGFVRTKLVYEMQKLFPHLHVNKESSISVICHRLVGGKKYALVPIGGQPAW